MLKETVIELSKVKLMLLVLGAFAFVLLGVWFLFLDAQTIENHGRFNNPTLIYGIGLSSIVFFGLCGFIGIKKLFDESPGLVISSEGILDNSNGLSAGIIPWSDVVGIGEYMIKTQRFVSIYVQDPEKYINTGNILKRMAYKANLRMCGTPINISANSLNISYDELVKTIEDYYTNSRVTA